MMRVAVTGKYGQVSSALRMAGPALGAEIICLARPEFDLTDAGSVAGSIERAKPDVVISAAAYTAVDAAEDEPRLAFQVNADGPRHLARAAARLGVPVIHLSTDYVFDGRSGAPYGEGDEVNPLSHYGRSKLAGEAAIRTASENHAIVRTAWVHSPLGRNFVRTMLRLAGERETVRVVADQVGSPTAASHLATALLGMAHQMVADADPRLRGTFHMVDAGACNWADFAEEIFRISGAAGGPVAAVERIGTDQFPTPAPRPPDSRLSTAKLAERFGIALPRWQDGVADTVVAIAERDGWVSTARRRAS